ncbi:hypothetical protein G6F53_013365 [Rhizopus delemar]|nr:hypothetical protein G6F53_013365 [Rhizopus delemar]
MTRTRGWSKKGKPTKAVVPASRDTSITILGAISSQGVIDISLRKPITVAGSKKRKSDGKVIQTTARVGTRTEHYLAYLSNVMDVLDKNDMKGFYLVMDNAPIHKPATVFKTPFNLRRHLMSPAHSEALPSRPSLLTIP